MKRFLSVCLVVVLVATGAWAQEFEQETVKPRNDLAFTFGLPGIFNLSYTNAFADRLGVRLTGGGLFVEGGHWLGAQGELFLTLEHTQTFTADLSFGLGTFTVADRDDNGSISYAAVLVNIRYRRLVTQIGTGPILGNSGNLRDGAVAPFAIGIILARFK